MTLSAVGGVSSLGPGVQGADAYGVRVQGADAYGVSAAHTSVPRHSGVRADPTAAAHLVVAEAPGESTERLLAELRELGAPIQFLVGAGAEASLVRVLGTASIGVRVYVVGSERFVRAIAAAATGAGLTEDELFSEIVGSRSRRVRCIHCQATTEKVSTSIVTCSGCAAPLLVYHHFSRRHSAYMGYRADAEVPGELPEAQPLWP